MKKFSQRISLIVFLIIGSTLHLLSQPIVDSLILELAEASNDTSKVILLNKITREYRIEDPKKALEFNTRALKLGKELDYVNGLAKSYELLGTICFYQSNYKMALDNYYKSIDLYKQIKDSQGLAYVYNLIGGVFLNLNDYDKALEMYSEAYKINEEIKNTKELAKISNNMGIIYKKKNLDSLALYYYTSAYEMNKKINRKRGMGYASMNVGNVFVKQGFIKKAKYYYLRSLNNFLEDDDLSGLTLAYFNVGNIYTHLNQFDSASFYLSKSKYLAQEYSLLEQEKQCLIGFRGMYGKQGNKDAVIKCLEEQLRIQDTLLQRSNEKTIEDMEKKIKFEQAMKTQEFELLEKSKKLKINTLQKYILIIILVSLTIIGVILINRKKLKIRYFNEKLESKNNELISFAMYILQKNDLIHEFREQLLKLQKRLKIEDNKKTVDEIINSLIFKIAISKDIEIFRDKLRIISEEFYRKLKQKYPGLTRKEKQLATLIRLNFTSKQIGVILNNATESVENSRYRLRKKMGLTSDSSLKDVLNQI